jgi:hypothetical protein
MLLRLSNSLCSLIFGNRPERSSRKAARTSLNQAAFRGGMFPYLQWLATASFAPHYWHYMDSTLGAAPDCRLWCRRG